MAYGRRLLETVTGESTCAPEAVEVVDRTQNRLMIGGHLVEACPSRSYSGRAQLGRSAFDDFSHRVERGPIDRSIETRRFVWQPHAKEQALTLRVEVEGSAHVDCHGVITHHRRHRFGDEDVAWIGLHWNG